jgi:hypothetical protein
MFEKFENSKCTCAVLNQTSDAVDQTVAKNDRQYAYINVSWLTVFLEKEIQTGTSVLHGVSAILSSTHL